MMYHQKGFAPIITLIAFIIVASAIGLAVSISWKEGGAIATPTPYPYPSSTPTPSIFPPFPTPSLPVPTPSPVSECKSDADCPSPQYTCQEIMGVGTACPNNSKSCIPTHTILKGECKLKEGNRCSIDSDCAAGNLCHKNICISPIGRQCSGPSDPSCPTHFECIQGCGPPVSRQDDPPPPYFCQLKGYIRSCPICLAKGTLIDTPHGQVPVQDLQAGDMVWTVDASRGRTAVPLLRVSETPVSATHKVVHLVLEDDRGVYVSGLHPTADGRTVGALARGDWLDGSRVVSSDLIPYGAPSTYDILPAGQTGLYIANGIILKSTLAQ